jgi:tight adherence protein B
MMFKPFVLAIVAVVASGAAVFLFVSRGYAPLWRWLAASTDKDTGKYEGWARELSMKWSREKMKRAALSGRVGVAAVACLTVLLTGSPIFAAATAFAAFWLPKFLYERARRNLLQRMDEQLPDAVGVMVASVRAGNSLSRAIKDVSLKLPDPLAREFAIIFREHEETGLRIEESLRQARMRIPVEAFTLVSSALIISSEHGGDLLLVLERMAAATRELHKLQNKVKVEMSEVRAQERVILVMTPVMAVIICLSDPDIPSVLFHSTAGNVLLVMVVAIQVASVAWIQRIVKTAI